MADWYNNAPVAGDQIAATTSSWNYTSSTQVQHSVSVYFSSVPLEPGKTVASVTLPTVSSGAGNGENALHIFAIAIGSGTPIGNSVKLVAGVLPGHRLNNGPRGLESPRIRIAS
jgi:hypothetical protein